MGLDHVELIMRVEEEFGIEIFDKEAELVSTPGALCALIERKLGVLDAKKRSLCPTSRAFYRVRRELMQLGVERANIKPNSSLHVLLPRPNAPRCGVNSIARCPSNWRRWSVQTRCVFCFSSEQSARSQAFF